MDEVFVYNFPSCGGKDGRDSVLLIFSLVIFIPMLIVIIWKYKNSNKFIDKSYDNFEYKNIPLETMKKI